MTYCNRQVYLQHRHSKHRDGQVYILQVQQVRPETLLPWQHQYKVKLGV